MGASSLLEVGNKGLSGTGLKSIPKFLDYFMPAEC